MSTMPVTLRAARARTCWSSMTHLRCLSRRARFKRPNGIVLRNGDTQMESQGAIGARSIAELYRQGRFDGPSGFRWMDIVFSVAMDRPIGAFTAPNDDIPGLTRRDAPEKTAPSQERRPPMARTITTIRQHDKAAPSKAKSPTPPAREPLVPAGENYTKSATNSRSEPNPMVFSPDGFRSAHLATPALFPRKACDRPPPANVYVYSRIRNSDPTLEHPDTHRAQRASRPALLRLLSARFLPIDSTTGHPAAPHHREGRSHRLQNIQLYIRSRRASSGET